MCFFSDFFRVFSLFIHNSERCTHTHTYTHFCVLRLPGGAKVKKKTFPNESLGKQMNMRPCTPAAAATTALAKVAEAEESAACDKNLIAYSHGHTVHFEQMQCNAVQSVRRKCAKSRNLESSYTICLFCLLIYFRGFSCCCCCF